MGTPNRHKTVDENRPLAVPADERQQSSKHSKAARKSALSKELPFLPTSEPPVASRVKPGSLLWEVQGSQLELIPKTSKQPVTPSRTHSSAKRTSFPQSPHPSAPLHSPHVLAARRRSLSVKPESSSQLTAGFEPRTPLSAIRESKRRKTGKKSSARPSETLDAPQHTPTSESEDPLLLKGGEETTGWGEGKPIRYTGRQSFCADCHGRSDCQKQDSKTTIKAGRLEGRLMNPCMHHLTTDRDNERNLYQVFDEGYSGPEESGELQSASGEPQYYVSSYGHTDNGEQNEEQDLGGYNDFHFDMHDAGSDGNSEIEDEVDMQAAESLTSRASTLQPKTSHKTRGFPEYTERIEDFIVPIRGDSETPPPLINPMRSETEERTPSMKHLANIENYKPSPFLSPPDGVPLRSNLATLFPLHAKAVLSLQGQKEMGEELAADEIHSVVIPTAYPTRYQQTDAKMENVAQISELTGDQRTLDEPISLAEPYLPTAEQNRSIPASSSSQTSSPNSVVQQPILPSESLRGTFDTAFQALPDSSTTDVELDPCFASPRACTTRIQPGSLERLRAQGKVQSGRQAMAQKLPLLLRRHSTNIDPSISQIDLAGEDRVTHNLSSTKPDLAIKITEPRSSTILDIFKQIQDCPRAISRASIQADLPSQFQVVPFSEISHRAEGKEEQALFTPTASPLKGRKVAHAPSRSNFPVIEVSSNDAEAAARAAAILKIHHNYIEQGVRGYNEAFQRSRSASRASRSPFAVRSSRNGEQLGSGGVSDTEETLQTILSAAERDVIDTLVPDSVRSLRNLSSISRKTKDRHTPMRSSQDPDFISLATRDKSTWTKSDWRRLEKAYVIERQKAQREQNSVNVEVVLGRFLEKEGLEKSECRDQWSWEILSSRVEALQARRSRNAGTASSTSVPDPIESPADCMSTNILDKSHDISKASRVTAQSDGGGKIGSQKLSDSVLKTEEEEDRDIFKVYGPSDDVSSEESDRDDTDDTFFGNQRYRRDESEGVRPPLALASSRFNHLYSEPIEKPPLPVQSWLPPPDHSSGKASVDTATLETATRASAEQSTLESPSSTRRVFSYLHSVIRGAPKP